MDESVDLVEVRASEDYEAVRAVRQAAADADPVRADRRPHIQTWAELSPTVKNMWRERAAAKLWAEVEAEVSARLEADWIAAAELEAP